MRLSRELVDGRVLLLVILIDQRGTRIVQVVDDRLALCAHLVLVTQDRSRRQRVLLCELSAAQATIKLLFEE